AAPHAHQARVRAAGGARGEGVPDASCGPSSKRNLAKARPRFLRRDPVRRPLQRARRARLSAVPPGPPEHPGHVLESVPGLRSGGGMTLAPYIRRARPSHWFKNLFMLPGILLVFFFDPAFR